MQILDNRLVTAFIPLKNMFLFCRGFDKVTRGLRHRIILNRQADNQMILRDLNTGISPTDDRFVSIQYISMWIPCLKPSLQVLKDIEAKLVSNDIFDVNFTDLTTFRTAQVQVGNASNSALQLSTTTKKPIRVWVAFQRVERVNERVHEKRGVKSRKIG